MPAILGGKKKVSLVCDVVPGDLPLLLSKNSMQKAHAQLDFANNIVTMFGEDIDLSFTLSGHYCILVTQPKSNAFFSLDKSATLKEKMQAAKKLHKQFSHVAYRRLQKLVIDGGTNDKDLLKMLKTVEQNCETCAKFKKPPSKPIVTLPRAREFNESVAMDLKFINSKPVLHLIDHATRYSAAIPLGSKHRNEVITKIFQIWISYFGSPKKILSDGGGEFNNDDFRCMGESLNTVITSTAAESPWSNGVNERHNAILGSMIDKVLADTKCNLSIAVASAVSSKNALANVHGFSPNQLVFGTNPNLPTNLNNKLPVLDAPI